MAKPTKRELVGYVATLQTIIQEMFGAYANDVAMGRAERMDALRSEADALAQPVIDAFPYEYPVYPERAHTQGDKP